MRRFGRRDRIQYAPITECVLWDRAFPSMEIEGNRPGAYPQQSLQISVDQMLKLIVRTTGLFRVPGASDEGRQKHRPVRGAMWKERG